MSVLPCATKVMERMTDRPSIDHLDKGFTSSLLRRYSQFENDERKGWNP